MAATDPSQLLPRRPAPLTVRPELVPPLMHPGMYLYDPQMKMMAEYQHNCVKTAALSGVVGFGMGGLMGLFMSSMRYDTPFHTPTPENTPGYVAPATAGAGGATAPTTTTTTTPAAAAHSAVSSTTPSSTPSSIRSAVAANPSITTTASATSTTVSAASTAPTTSTLATSSTPTITTTATTVSPSAATTLSSSSTVATPHPSAPSSTPAAFRPPEATTMAQVRAGFRDMGKQSFSMARNFGKIGLIFSGVECGIEGMRGSNDATNGIAAGCLTGGILARNSGPYAVATGCAGFAVFSAAVEAYLRSEGSEE